MEHRSNETTPSIFSGTAGVLEGSVGPAAVPVSGTAGVPGGSVGRAAVPVSGTAGVPGGSVGPAPLVQSTAHHVQLGLVVHPEHKNVKPSVRQHRY